MRRCSLRRALVLAGLLLLGACRGPTPYVGNETLGIDAGNPNLFRVEAVVGNRGGGRGQVEVTATVAARGSDRVLAQATKAIVLGPHESISVVFRVPRPASASALTPEQLDLRVVAAYPIE